ncbi:MAG: outer membrane beta-barrel protein, partial [Bacteroidia bacterium]|nr:outer membrane beta-barrel protein [Bacteroidia bacterium]
MKPKIAITIMVLAASLLSNRTYSQGIYAKINAGYGLNMGSQRINYFNFTNFSIDTVSSTKEQVNTSLGKGFVVEGAVGYMFNKNIGAEIGISYLLGAKTKTNQVLYGTLRNNSLSANMLRLNPSLVISCGFDKINPYARFGLIVGFGKIRYEDDYTSSGGIVVSEKMEFNGGIAWGLTAGAGASFNISKMLALFGEINMVNLSYAPTHGKLTESTFHGTDRLPNLTKNEKEVDFVDSYTTNLNYPY